MSAYPHWFPKTRTVVGQLFSGPSPWLEAHLAAAQQPGAPSFSSQLSPTLATATRPAEAHPEGMSNAATIGLAAAAALVVTKLLRWW